MIRFNFFQKEGAFTRNEDGQYAIVMDKMEVAIDKLSAAILVLQGNGDYEGVDALVKEMGVIKPTLERDLQSLADAGIPVDITFIQGKDVLGLN